MRRFRHLPVVLLVLSAFVPAAFADEWFQWRGPDRDGHAPMFTVPDTWPEEPQELWRVEVGEGHTSPIVSGDRIYLMARQGEDEVAMALALDTGKVLWAHKFPTPYTMHQAAIKHGKGPKSTPVVADGVACFLGVDARFSCHEADSGKVLWVKDFSEQSGPEETFCGSSFSPLVDNGVLYVHLGDDRAGRFIAADLRTGKEKWGWDGMGPGYASPIFLHSGGQRHLVTFAAVALLGFEPSTGELLWKHPYANKWKENISTPLVIGETLLIGDYENGSLALWPTKTEDGWTVDEHWVDKELTLSMSSPVTDGETVYGFSKRKKGQLFTLDPKSGKILWQDAGRGGDNAFLTLAGDWLLVSSTDAELKVMHRADRKLKEVKRYTIAPSSVWAHPAWLADGLLVKDVNHLARLSLTAPKPAKAEARR